MIGQLEDFLQRVRGDRHLLSSNEETTRIGVILPVLARLDWDRDNVREVVPEFPVGSGRVDYCLRVGEKNSVFIEAKRISEELERHQEQLLDYAFREGVEMAVLTNGLVWWLYLPLLGGSWEQRKFFTINVEHQDVESAAMHFRAFLARAAIADGSAVLRARELHAGREKDRLVKQMIPKAWNQLCQDPDELMLEIFADKVESLCGHKPDHAQLADYLASFASGQAAVPLPIPHIAKVARAPMEHLRRQPSNAGVYTYTRPIAFVFQGYRHPVSSFKDILVGLCSLLYKAHSSDYDRVLSLRGRKRVYFSRDFRAMTSPAEIPGAGIYVETNLSANNTLERCTELLEMFGYSRDDLKVET